MSKSKNMPTTKELGLRYRTTEAFKLSSNIEWESIHFAKELINIREKMVMVNRGRNPISTEDWKNFNIGFPYKRNLDRHLLFTKTAFLRSPNVTADCKGDDCFTIVDDKNYTWAELAKPLAINYNPSKTNTIKPEKGHLVVKIIQKCQAVVFENEIYEMSDNKGNAYVMHATETGTPNLNVQLPEGFSIKKKMLKEPLIVVPFGENDDCYFNIVGDHLGQGYHQYKYANNYYPK